ncbi:MAG: UbiD family decarboxylase [Planctomycetota bacterium]|nr:MAG: UbiD family decarboxylase [Planctomycetota bacterium]
MPLESTGDFLKILEAEGELLRVRAEVNLRYQIAAVTAEARRHPNGGPALLFESVRDSRYPVVSNLLGSPKRVQLACGASNLTEISARIMQWIKPGWGESRSEPPVAAPSLLSRLTRLGSKPVKNAFSQQVVRLGRDVNLEEFAFPRHFEGETGRTITGAQLMLTSPDGQRRTISSPVLEIAGPQSLLVHWPLSDEGPDRVAEHRALGKQTPVMISLGGDPLLSLAAQGPAVPDWDAYSLVGILRGHSLNLARGRTVELDAPADAEMLIEGYIDLQAIPAEGTVATAAGFLVPRTQLAVIRVTALTHRAQPVIPVVVHSAAGNETDAWSPLLAALLQPLLERINPAIRAFEFYRDGAGRRIGCAAIETRHPGHARQALQCLASWPPLSDVVMIVGVDDPALLSEPCRLWAEVSRHADPAHDIWSIPAVRDGAHRVCRDLTRAATLLIDATRKPDPRSGDWIELAEDPQEAQEFAAKLWQQIKTK